MGEFSAHRVTIGAGEKPVIATKNKSTLFDDIKTSKFLFYYIAFF
jgi:hypothetical protein